MARRGRRGSRPRKAFHDFRPDRAVAEIAGRRLVVGDRFDELFESGVELRHRADDDRGVAAHHAAHFRGDTLLGDANARRCSR